MAKPIGSPNGTGDIKDGLIKFRASAEFIDLFNLATKSSVWFDKNKKPSANYRWMILEGLIRYVSDENIKDKIMEEIRKETGTNL